MKERPKTSAKGASVPQPISRGFKRQNLTKFGRKVSNTYYSRFRVEMSGYESPRITLRVLREDLCILPKPAKLGSAGSSYLFLPSTRHRLNDKASMPSPIET